MRITVYIATIIGLLFNFKVEAQPFTVINTNVTRGCDSLTIQFSYTTSLSVTSVMWNFGRGSSDISNLAVSNPIVYTPGLYIVTLVLNGNDTTRIRVGRPDANFTYRDTFDYGLFTIIFRGRVGNNTFSVPPYRYHWTIPGRTIDNPDSSFLIHQFDSAGIYRTRLIVRDSWGCIDTVFRLVVVTDTLIVPNVFTPNDDGINDEFRVPSNGKNILSFRIFSRTGLMIFQTETKILNWNGRLASGDKALPGIYYYIIETLDASPPIKKSGFFYLYR